jgi:hypothetical protein
MTRAKRFSPEVREPSVRLVRDHQAEYATQWAAITQVRDAGLHRCRERTTDGKYDVSVVVRLSPRTLQVQWHPLLADHGRMFGQPNRYLKLTLASACCDTSPQPAVRVRNVKGFKSGRRRSREINS